ncbi:30082_t:CDS:2, partial [Gigaspora margarita]
MQYSETYPTDSTPLESNIEKMKRLIEYRLLGGDGLHDITGKQICSVGLWVRDSNGQDYIMTAGHCEFFASHNQQGFVDFYQKGWYSLPTYNYIGPLEYSSYAPYDFGLIRYIGTNVTLSTKPGVVSSVGVSLCISGHTSHVICGKVVELDVVVRYQHPISKLNFTKRELIRTDIECGSGDSGGTVFYYDALRIPYVVVVGTVVGIND